MTWLWELDRIGAGDRGEVGGKGWNLARLAGAGLPVPPAVVLPAHVFRDALVLAGLGPGKVDPEGLAAAVVAMPLPQGLAEELIAAGRRLGPRVAVRSSALDEDSATRSFAGQYETVLGVSPEAVPDAVRRVWASLWSPEAAAYRAAGGDTGDGSMAVVIQHLVEPRCSGVMFTVNPLSGSWREMTVESTWGLGEGLVSGQVAPHWYLVRRPRGAPRPVRAVAARVRLQLMQQDLPDIREIWEVDDRGEIARRPTPSALRHRPTLDARALLRLCRLGLEAEALLGGPQDVEWALDHGGKLHLLQARPITSSAAPHARHDVLWTRRFLGERWPEPATPLGWSIIEPVLDHFIAFPDTQARYLGGGPAVRLVHSRPYLNATAFRHLAFKLPGSPPPRFMMELVPPSEEVEWQRRFAAPPDVGAYLGFLRETWSDRRWERFRWNPFTNPRSWDDFERRLEAELPALSHEPASPEDAVRIVRAQRDLVRDYVAIHVCSLLFANLFYQLLEGALATWVPERAASLMRRLASTPPGNRTLETNEALWELSRHATEADLAALERGDRPGVAFGEALGRFLARYGHRSHASWEILADRWATAPHRLVPFLRSHLAAGEEPLVRARRQEDEFVEARAELRGAVGLTRRPVADVLVDYTRRYLLLRENQRFAFDRLLFAMQRSLTWLGEDFRRRGWLDDAHDVAFLTWTEVSGLAQGSLPPEPVREWVERRRRRRDEDARIDPPVFLRGDEAVAEVPVGARMQGLGISPGRYRGRVRIVRTTADGQRMAPGEVLVAHAIDPGWTPLLQHAGAAVLEMGSRLSHGAVVAREYGVPAVVNIDGVVRSLRDGQEVTVDGTRGTVWVHP